MAMLLNRKYSSRLECLYYILKTTYMNFGKNPFIISDVKYNEDLTNNIFDNCDLLEMSLDILYCPFLDNPLNDAKCYATQSQKYDSTKSKAASSVVRAWEALGFVEPSADKFVISPQGIDFVNTNFETIECFEIIQKGVLSYGPILGYIQSALEEGESFNFSKLYIGYPSTDEPIELSTNSTRDSNTRTVSMLTSWCIQAGLIEPLSVKINVSKLPHLAYRKIINAKKLGERNFRVTMFARDYISKMPYIRNPLSYNNLNKNVGSLREKGSATIRGNTQKYNPLILNRRFMILYVINNREKPILLSTIVSLFKRHQDKFFLPNSDVAAILQAEIGISKLSGLILKFKAIDGDVLIQKYSVINNDIISFEAPEQLLNIANSMVNEI